LTLNPTKTPILYEDINKHHFIIAFEVVTRAILDKMFDEFKANTKESFFDELDEKFREFQTDFENRNKIDLDKFVTWIDHLESEQALYKNQINELRNTIASVEEQDKINASLDKIQKDLSEMVSQV